MELCGKNISFIIDESGRVCSFYNRMTGHEYISIPGWFWKMIYQEGERLEIPIYSTGQEFTAVCRGNTLELVYKRIKADDRNLNIYMKLVFVMKDNELAATVMLVNNDASIQITEISITAVSGITSLGGEPKEDCLTVPEYLGRNIKEPYVKDLGRTGFLYRSNEQYHRDINLLYPGRASMQWYDLNNKKEGIYVGSHDPSMQITNLHVERDVSHNSLRLCINKYVLTGIGEKWECAPIVFAVHKGDWHEGSKIYRRWIESAGIWTAPACVEWVRNLSGWLRIILKSQYGEINFKYSQLPDLFDEAYKNGINTLFLIGWEKNGFERLYPEYDVDEDRLGGKEELTKAISYIHSKGGHIVFFVSYYLISFESDFYKYGGGKGITIRSVWNREITFNETHAGEGTMRMYANPLKPEYCACQDTILWQEKLREFADIVFSLGADAIMYDIGAYGPYLCFAKNHLHTKPYTNTCSKAGNYKKLKEYVRNKDSTNAIMMEFNVDIFGQHMDIAQPVSTMNPEQEFGIYRYTFPELILTNRDCAHDEDNYKNKVNYSIFNGLRFDMSILRCRGRLSDIPRYTEYLSGMFKLLKEYRGFIYTGRFIDNEGFVIDNNLIKARAYQRRDGSIAVLVWNPDGERTQAFTIKAVDTTETADNAAAEINIEAGNSDFTADAKPDRGCSIGIMNTLPFHKKQIKAVLEPNSIGIYIIR